MTERVSEERVHQFAKFVIDNVDVLDAVLDHTKQRLFEKFVTASDAERVEISNIINASTAFKIELTNTLTADIQNING